VGATTAFVMMMLTWVLVFEMDAGPVGVVAMAVLVSAIGLCFAISTRLRDLGLGVALGAVIGPVVGLVLLFGFFMIVIGAG
jgi:hypothetical protein